MPCFGLFIFLVSEYLSFLNLKQSNALKESKWVLIRNIILVFAFRYINSINHGVTLKKHSSENIKNHLNFPLLLLHPTLCTTWLILSHAKPNFLETKQALFDLKSCSRCEQETNKCVFKKEFSHKPSKKLWSSLKIVQESTKHRKSPVYVVVFKKSSRQQRVSDAKEARY